MPCPLPSSCVPVIVQDAGLYHQMEAENGGEIGDVGDGSSDEVFAVKKPGTRVFVYRGQPTLTQDGKHDSQP